MNFSTNQVIQLYVLDTATAPVRVDTAGGIQYVITHADGKVETTDLIKNVIGTASVVEATDDRLALKEAMIRIDSDLVVAGQEYVIALTFRGYSNEDTHHKVFAAKAKSTTLADLYKDLALNAWLQRGVEAEPLYDIYVGGTKIETKAALEAADLGEGFSLIEATPYWRLGSFVEAASTIEIGTSPVWVSGTERNDWLVDDEGNPVQFKDYGSTTIANTHKIADLEYFAKGERGNSNAFAGWPDNIEPDLYIDSKDTTGYAVLTVHYAFVGSNDEVQKSERDAIFVAKQANKSLLDTIATAVNALDKIA